METTRFISIGSKKKGKFYAAETYSLEEFVDLLPKIEVDYRKNWFEKLTGFASSKQKTYAQLKRKLELHQKLIKVSLTLIIDEDVPKKTIKMKKTNKVKK